MQESQLTSTADISGLEVRETGAQAKKSSLVRPGERRTKRGRKKASTPEIPPLLSQEDYVRVVRVPKRSEVLHEGWRPVSLSKLDKAGQIEVDDSLSTATSHKGYRMVRATHGACEGTWYYEATVKHLGSTGHVRIGWSTRKGELQAPVGYDAFSYAYRDLEGTKVHKALREPYGEAFQEGDVIGCFIHLGNGGRPFEKERSDIVTWKGNLYFKEDFDADSPKPISGSLVAFTRNGKLQGIAYRDVPEGTYYPAVSLYTLPEQKEGASVEVNFGQSFKFPGPQFEGVPPAQPTSVLAGEPPASLSDGDQYCFWQKSHGSWKILGAQMGTPTFEQAASTFSETSRLFEGMSVFAGKLQQSVSNEKLAQNSAAERKAPDNAEQLH